MTGIDLRHLRPQLLETVNQTTQPPSPFAIGTITDQIGIQAIEVMLSPVMMRTPLGIVVHLTLMEGHQGNRPVLKQLLGQGDHTRADHQGIWWLPCLRIIDHRAQGERLTINSHIHHEGSITLHTGLHLTGFYGRFLADAIMLDHVGDVTTTFLPVSKGTYTLQRIRQLTDHRQLIRFWHHRLCQLATCILHLIHTWNVALPQCHQHPKGKHS